MMNQVILKINDATQWSQKDDSACFNLPRVVTSLSPGSLKKYFCDDCEVLFLQKDYF